MTQKHLGRDGRQANHFITAIGLLMGIAAFATAAHAQRIYLGGLHGANLSRQDWHALRIGVQRLLDRTPARVGETQAWAGPDRVQGTVTILRVFEQSGMPCRELRATFGNKNAQRKQYNANVCRTSTGDWKLAD
jgi:surface antigen